MNHFAAQYWERQAAEQELFSTVMALAEVQLEGWEVFHVPLRGGAWLSRLCTDVYLEALAITNGWRQRSFDRNFGRLTAPQRLPLP
jgi:hypothetical protein